LILYSQHVILFEQHPETFFKLKTFENDFFSEFPIPGSGRDSKKARESNDWQPNYWRLLDQQPDQ